MARDPELARLLHRNRLGKQGAEGWGEWWARTWRSATCRLIGHAAPNRVMDGGWICSRCRVVLPRRAP